MISDEFEKYQDAMLDFDTRFWHFLCDRVNDRNESFAQLPEPVRNFYASRLLEWEVANGGFAQAAFNIPHLFEAAHQGYLALQLPDAAALIAEAQRIIAEGQAKFRTKPGEDIGELFEEFAESALAELDDKIDESGLWATELRTAYALQNRKVFEQMA